MLSSIGSGLGTAATDAGNSIGNLASTVGSGLETGANDIASGAQSLVGNLGQGVGGLFGMDGGGGPISPGSLTNPGGASLGGQLADGAAGAAAPAAATGAASFGLSPGAVAGFSDPGAIAPPPVIPGMDATTVGGPATAVGTSDFNQFTGQIAGQYPSPGAITGGQSTAGGPISGMVSPSSIAPGIGKPDFSFGGSPFLQSLMQPKTALPLGLLGTDLIMGSQTPAEVKTMQQMAAQQAGIAHTQGQLATAEQQGILPSGGQQLIEQTLKANEAAVRTKYAQMGMTGSSAEQQDLQAARDQAMSQQFTIGQQLAQTGLAAAQSASGMQSQLLAAILAEEGQQGGELANILGEFAGAAAK